MLKEYSAAGRYMMAIVDVLCILVAFFLSYYLRVGPLSNMPWFAEKLSPLQDYMWLVAFLLVCTPLLLYWGGAYRPFRRENILSILINLAFSVILTLFFSGALLFFSQSWAYSRGLLILWALVYFLIIASGRIVFISLVRGIRRKGFNFRRIVIVGENGVAREVITEIQAHSFWGMRIEGIITTRDVAHKEIFGHKVLGKLNDVETILREHAIDEAFCTNVPSRKSLEQLKRACIVVGCTLYIVPQRKKEYNHCKILAEQLGSITLLAYRTLPKACLQRFIKRVLDIFIAGIVMLVFPLIYVVVGAAIKLDSPGPVFYSSIRVAHNRRQFRCYKFRTMVNDAETLIRLLDEVNELTGPVRKSSRDPRITKVGRFLRKYSIDEIPQFINIFKGEMSLVGPRPPLPDEVEQYKLSDLRRLSMPQGITGFWQVNGRDTIKSFDERLKLDLAYIDNWSLWLDVKIMFKTFQVVLKGAA
jgi:exopolysaccharide biosynthesis polyprenyl glycosylphosphotransferase